MVVIIKVKVDGDQKYPEKAHAADAGYDLFAPYDFVVHPGDSTVVDLGVHMQIPDGYVGFIKSKSGLNVNKGILCEGVVDAGYTGSIKAKLYNHGFEMVKFRKGDKVTQIVILPIAMTALDITDELDKTERGDGGFGSTGI